MHLDLQQGVYLGKGVASVLTQRFENFELLIVDNASTDGTSKVIRRLRDPRIRYVGNLKQVGMAANFNRCLELALAGYTIAFHDDDLMKPELRLSRDVRQQTRRFAQVSPRKKTVKGTLPQ